MIEKISYANTFTGNIKSGKANLQNNVLVNRPLDTISFGNTKDISIIGKKFKDAIKIIFTDIDGTISPFSDMMSKNVISAINSLQKKKVPVILTTARCYADTLPISKQFNNMPDYTITLQGGTITDKSGKVLFQDKIPQKSAISLHEWFRTNNADKDTNLIMYFDDIPYCENDFQFPWKANTAVEKIDSCMKLFDDGKTFQKAIIYKANKNGNLFENNPALDALSDLTIDGLTITPSSYCFYEVQNGNVSKDRAIDYILKRTGIKPQNTMVIGDSANDIEMLDFIGKNNGLAIAMGDANDTVKAHANAITNTIADDGFSYAIKQIFTKL